MKRSPIRLLLGLSFCLLAAGAITQEATPPVPEIDEAGQASVSTPPPAPVSAQPSASPLNAGQRVLNALPSGAKVAVIPIEGMIYGFTLDSLERRVDRAIAAGATVIVLELNTPGGVVTDAIAICRYLKNLQGVTTIAWVRDEAYSAGSLIATACDLIFVSPSSSFGDSAPVMMGGELAPTERAKALSPVLDAYDDNATVNGYDYAPLHAMCVLGVEVYYVQHRETGERRLVNQADFAVMVGGEEPADVEASLTEGLSADDELARVGAPRVSVARAEMGAWEPVLTLPSGATLPNGRVHDGTTLYTLSQTEAVDIGLATAIVADEAALRTRLNAASVTRVEQTWSESMAGFLTNPFVRGVLVLCVLVGAYVEFQSPGLGFPGAVAGIALIALLGAPLVVGLAEVWHLIILVIGLGLLIVELVATPTFGLLGIVGIVMMLAGLALSVVPTGGGGPIPLPAPGTSDVLVRSAVSTTIAFILSVAAMIGVTYFYGSIPFLNRLILTEDDATAARGRPDRTAEIGGDFVLGGAGQPLTVGTSATVSETGLRPSGRIDVQGTLIDAVSTGGFIDPGTKVRVIEVAGNRIVVDEA
ncbi:MAG: NfeD family protein [Planctomycetota bacterium]